MTRRSRGSGKEAKGRRCKAKTPKRGSAPTLRRSSSAASQESEFARLRRERDEAATPEVDINERRKAKEAIRE